MARKEFPLMAGMDLETLSKMLPFCRASKPKRRTIGTKRATKLMHDLGISTPEDIARELASKGRAR